MSCKKFLVDSQIFIIVRSITSTFMNGFQNNFVRVFLTSTSVMRKVCFNMPKVKVTVEDQMFKLTLYRA